VEEGEGMFSEHEVGQAKRRFYISNYGSQKINEKILPFLECDASPGWLKSAREALCISQAEMARRLRVARVTYYRLERAEKSGNISVKKLARLAKLMNCELVYAIRPISKRTFFECIWAKLISEVLNRRKSGDCYMMLQQVHGDTAFRRKNGWRRNLQLADPLYRAVRDALYRRNVLT
jgi:transcriptional regulator with XRE-family HTH domain